MKIQISKIPLLLGVLLSLHSPLIGKTISGLNYKVQPVVMATDEYGNVDVDYVKSVTLSSKGEGALGGTLTQVAVQGRVEFKDLNYTATADNENYALIANDSNFTEVTSAFILSDVVATKLTFTKEVSPLALYTGLDNDFTTDPIVKAVDAQGLVDVNFSEVVTLGHNGTGVGIFTNNSVTAVNGVATFENLTFNYDTTATIELVANDQDAIASDLTEALSSGLTFNVNVTAPVVTASPTASPVESSTDILVDSDNSGGIDTTVRLDSTLEVTSRDTDNGQSVEVQVGEVIVVMEVADNGQVNGSVALENEEGETVSSSIEIALPQSDTSIGSDGSISTSIDVEENEISITVEADGTVKYEVAVSEGETKAVTAIAGSSVKVTEEGTLVITSKVEKDGIIYVAVLTTQADGTTTTKFSRINTVTQEEVEVDSTLGEDTSYSVGSSSEIFELDDLIYIETTTMLNGTLSI